MMRLSTPSWGLLAVAVASAGCSESAEDLATANSLEIVRRYTIDGNGENINGTNKNGTNKNGTNKNGTNKNGNVINSVGAQNTEGANAELVGFEWGTLNRLRGVAWKDATIWARTSLGEETQVRIADVDTSTVPGMELYLVLDASNNEPVCGTKDGQPIWSTVMTSLFSPATGFRIAPDPALFTFACRFGAIQKCNEYGWPEWGTRAESNGSTTKIRNLDDYHDACIPMIRADYCGNGVSHTYNGTNIDIYDHLDNSQSMVTSTNGSDGYYFEAYWEADGAHCINKTRWMPSSLTTLAQNQSAANPDWLYIYNNCPRRFATEVRAGFPPDRDCDNPNFKSTGTGNGFDKHTARTTQTQRGLTGNNSRLERY